MICNVSTVHEIVKRKLSIHMPRGNPKRPVNLRLNPALLADVRKRSRSLTAAVEDGLRLYLKHRGAQKGETTCQLPRVRLQYRRGDGAGRKSWKWTAHL